MISGPLDREGLGAGRHQGEPTRLDDGVLHLQLVVDRDHGVLETSIGRDLDPPPVEGDIEADRFPVDLGG